MAKKRKPNRSTPTPDPTIDEAGQAADELAGGLQDAADVAADQDSGAELEQELADDQADVDELEAAPAELEDETPTDKWKPKKGAAVVYRYTMADGQLRQAPAKCVRVHRAAGGGAPKIDLEVHIPERPADRNPATIERVPFYVAPRYSHIGVPPSYSRP